MTSFIITSLLLLHYIINWLHICADKIGQTIVSLFATDKIANFIVSSIATQ